MWDLRNFQATSFFALSITKVLIISQNMFSMIPRNTMETSQSSPQFPRKSSLHPKFKWIHFHHHQPISLISQHCSKLFLHLQFCPIFFVTITIVVTLSSQILLKPSFYCQNSPQNFVTPVKFAVTYTFKIGITDTTKTLTL